MRNHGWIPTLICCLAGMIPLQAQGDWKLSKEQRGILVYTRDNHDFPVKEYRAEVTVEASFDMAVSFFSQTPRHADWMDGVVHVERYPGPSVRLFYTLELPFPFKDRCMWLYETVEEEEGTYTVRLAHAPGDIPDNLVRIPRVCGFWQFQEVGPGQTRIIQQFVSDPGEAMPDWLVNLFIVKRPYRTLLQLRSALLDASSR